MTITDRHDRERAREVFTSLTSVLREASELVNDALRVANILALAGTETEPHFTAENARALVADALTTITEANERAIHAHRVAVFSSFVADEG